jgi:hypothetical protein
LASSLWLYQKETFVSHECRGSEFAIRQLTKMEDLNNLFLSRHLSVTGVTYYQVIPTLYVIMNAVCSNLPQNALIIVAKIVQVQIYWNLPFIQYQGLHNTTGHI